MRFGEADAIDPRPWETNYEVSPRHRILECRAIECVSCLLWGWVEAKAKRRFDGVWGAWSVERCHAGQQPTSHASSGPMGRSHACFRFKLADKGIARLVSQ
jgi:hypothetical protein